MNNDFCLRLVSLDVEEEEIHELLCVPQVYEYLADGVEPAPSIARDWIRQSADDFDRFGGGLWALESAWRHQILGLTRLSDFDDGELQLTYLLHPSIWGRGYATRMAHTAMNRAFTTRVATSVWAGADVANEASVSVLKHLGMSFRRDVDYPAGPGVEYVMTAAAFDDRRFDPLPVVSQSDPSEGHGARVCENTGQQGIARNPLFHRWREPAHDPHHRRFQP